ncbi:MAG: helix-hairpin-helix domain-containing protein, partial [Acidobacteriota bacterium]
NINTATKAELEALPGVGAATAKKIIAGRPYATVSDLSKSGVSAATRKKITPLVTVGTSAGAATTTATTSGKTGKTTASDTIAQTPPSPGMVWVNTSTKVFHREGDKYYGKTKRGKYMAEADALKAGYREAKVSGAPKK